MVITSWLAALTSKLFGFKKKTTRTRKQQSKLAIQSTQPSEVLETRTLMTVNAVNDDYLTGINEDTVFDSTTSAVPSVLTNDDMTNLNGSPLANIFINTDAGSASMNTDGTFTYDPGTDLQGLNHGESVVKSFLYVVTDSDGNGDPAFVNMTVQGLNDQTTATNVSQSVGYTEDDGAQPVGTPIVVDDPDIGDVITATLTMSDPTAGTLSAPGGDFASGVLTISGTKDDVTTALASLTFTPAANYNDNFTIDVSVSDDGEDGTVPVTGTISMNGTAVNDAPVANNYTPTMLPGGTLDSSVVATDVENDPLTYSLGSDVTQGVLTFNPDGTYEYVPDVGFHGVDSFTYTANDGTDDSNVGVVNITVNTAPVATGASLNVDEDDVLNDSVSATDGDDDDLTYSVVADVTHGLLTLHPDGSFTYTPDANYHGPDSFTFKANDGFTDSNTATITLTVDSVNDVPVAGDSSENVDEDDVLDSSVSATDADLQSLTYSVVGNVSHGVLDFHADGTYTYTPTANYNGPDSFTFKATDGTADSNTATVSITVNSVNDVPVASDSTENVDEDDVLDSSVSATDADLQSLTYSVVGNVSHGVLDFHADGTYTYTPAANYNGPDGFTFKATDGTADSNTATVSITVNSVNDVPVASDSSEDVDEDDVLNSSVSATDADLQSLTYSVVGNVSHGVLDFHADGTYTYTPTANYHGPDSFTFEATDGTADSNTATVTITVNSVTDAPVATSGSLTFNEDGGQLTSTVHATDADGDDLTYILVDDAQHGTLAFRDDGSFDYTPDEDFNGDDTFTFKVNDGTSNSNTATFTITMTPVNDAPVADDDAVNVDEDQVLNASVSASDVDLDDLTYALVDDVSNGVLVFHDDGSYTYTPNGNYHGSDSFTFTANDGALDSNIATISITVGAVNDAPLASDGSDDVDEDQILNGIVFATDIDGDDLTYILVGNASHGVLNLRDDGSYDYTPEADFHGTDTFTFKANDGTVDSNTATMTITVNSVNDAPVANDDNVNVDEDDVLNGTVTASDVDLDSLTFTLGINVTHGVLDFHADGTYTYTPEANYHGSDSFVFTANDGSLDSNDGVVFITVNSVNDAPVADSDIISVDEDDSTSGSVSASDVEGDDLTYILVDDAMHGTLHFNDDGTYDYTPNPDYNGPDSFTYKANDGTDDSNIATVDITVFSVNDDPVANDDAYTLSEDSFLEQLSGGVLDNDSDLHGGAPGENNTPLSAVLIDDVSHGTLNLNSDGTFTYTPEPDFFGTDSFIYQVTDSQSGLSNIATVTFTVNGVQDVPVASDSSETVAEDGTLNGQAMADDVDGDDLTYSVVNDVLHGTLDLHADGSYTYTPFADYNGTDSFTFKVNDGTDDSNTATVNITVTSVNDAPVAGNDTYSTDEDTPLIVSAAGVLANDSDLHGGAPNENNTPLSANVVANPSHGTLTLNTDGSFTYTPASNYNGADSFTYTATDSATGVSNVATVNINVIAVNDAPSVLPVSVSVNEDGILSDSVSGTDVENSPLTYIQVGDVSHGVLVFNSDGTYTYTPAANFNGTDSFGYKANDGTADSNTATVTITVNAVNDVPTFTVGANQSVAEDAGTQSVNNFISVFSPGPADESGQAINFIVDNNNHSLFSVQPAIDATGKLTYTPAADQNGTATVTVQIHDNGGTALGGVDTSVSQTFTITITSVNDAPVAGDDSYETNEDTALNINAVSGVLANDSDTHAGAPGENNTPLVPTVVANPTHGSLTLNNDGSFTYTPNADYNGTDSFTYHVTDSQSGVSNTATVTITVDSVNDAPSFTVGANQTVAEDAGAQSVSNFISVFSPGPADEAGQAVNFIVDNNNHALFSVQPAIDATGKLTYALAADQNGTATVTVQIHDDGGTALGGVDTSVSQTFTITITSVNDDPVAADDTYEIDEDTVLNITAIGGVLANDSDAHGGAPGENNTPLVPTVVNNPLHGSLTLNADGSFTYTPIADYNGTDSFTYHVTDSLTGVSNSATVTITVDSVNDDPVAADDSYATDEDTPLTVLAGLGVLANDSDLHGGAPDEDNTPLVASVVDDPTHGDISLNDDGSFTYTPEANFFGTDTFTYEVEDSQGGVSDTVTVTITVNPVNDAPVADDDSQSVDEDSVLNGTVSASDVDNVSLTYAVVGGVSHGTLDFHADGTYTYTPTANYNGSDSFTFKANDGALDSNIATVSITIDPVNDAPVASNSAENVDEDDILNGSVSATDVDLDPLTYSVVSSVSNGSLSFNDDGTYTYTPDPDFNGTDTFTFKANDGDLDSNTATVTITVNSVNDVPVATADSYTTSEDTVLNVDAATGVLFNDSDSHGGAPSESNTPLVAVVDTQPAHGTLALNDDGSFSYTPNADYNGSDSFTYHVIDTLSGISNTATVSLTITPVNDSPVAANDSYSTNEDTPLTVAASGVLSNDSDLHGGAPGEDNTPLTAAIVANPGHGSVTLNIDGSFTYTPDTDYNGTDTFTYKAVDSLTGESNVATVTITVNSANDAPIAADDTYSTDEDTPLTVTAAGVLSNDSDLHGGAPSENNTPLTVSIVANPTHGSVTLNADGSFTYTPNTDYNGTDTFTYHVTDGLGAISNTATVTLTVLSVNDAPVATDDLYATDEDTPLTILTANGVLANDSDDHGGAPGENNLPLAASVVADPTHGTVTLNADGSFTYTPDADFNGTDSFTYRVADSQSAFSNTATVLITVASVNDEPVVADDNYVTDEDTPLTVTAALGVLANDSDSHNGAPDEDNTPLTVGIVNDPTHGTITLNTDGSFTYTPDADFNGTDSFTYEVTDSLAGVSNEATVNITVNSVNDVPNASDDAYSTTEDTPLTIDAGSGVLLNDSDLHGGALGEDNTPLVPTVVANPAHGTVTLSNDGSFIYTPDADFNGTDTFTYRVQDSQLGFSNTATVTITVDPVNDAPSFTAGPDQTIIEDATPQTIANWATAVSAGPADEVGQALTFSVTGNTNPGLFAVAPAVAADGTLTFQLAAGVHGSADITIVLMDDGGGTDTSAPQTFSIHSIPINQAPTFTLGADPTVMEDAAAQTVVGFATNISAGSAEETGQTVTFHVTTSNDAAFTTLPSIDPVTGTLTYLTAPNANGNIVVTVTLSDDGGTANGGVDTSAPQTFTIHITPVNDTPVAGDDSATTLEDTGVDVPILANDSDVDGDHLLVFVGAPSHGSAYISGNSIHYTPAPNYNGTDTVDYLIFDGHGGSAAATVTITITPVNDAPTAGNGTITTAEDTPFNGVSLPGTDIDSGSLTFTIVDQPTHGTISNFNPATGAYTYTPNANYFGSDSFTYKTNDGEFDSNVGTISVTVTPVDDPVTAQNSSLTTAEDTPSSGTLTFSDIDSDTLNFTIVSPPAHGTITGFNAATGAFTYNPDANYNGPDSFTFKVNDGTSDSNTATVSITVTSVNDAPVVNASTFTLAEGTANAVVVGTVTATDVDAGDTRSFAITGGNTNGAFTINPVSGVITVANSAALDFEATPTFDLTVTVTDNGTPNQSGTAHITVNLTNVAEQLVLSLPSNPATFVAKHSAVVIDAAASAADQDTPNIVYNGGSLTVQITGNASSKDVLEIFDPNGGITGIDLKKGGKINFNNVLMGTFSGGKSSTALTINFTAGATEAAVNALLKLITFRTNSKPSTAQRTVTFNLKNGDNSEHATATKAVNVAANIPARSIQLGTGEAVSYSNGAAPVVIDSGATVSGPSTLNFDGTKLTVLITSGISNQNRMGIKNVGGISLVGSDVMYNGDKIGRVTLGSNSLSVSLSGQATSQAAVQALMQSITFSTTSSNTLLINRMISFKLTELDGVSSATVNKQIHFV